MDRPLEPLPNWKLRWIVFGVTCLPALFSGVPWLWKLVSFALVAVLVGSTREARIVGPELVAQQFIAFLPLAPQRCKLPFVVEILAANRKDVGAADWLLMGGFNWFMDRIMQWVWPWMAGELELWVVTARDKRMLVWRGNSDEEFQVNLAALISTTGARVTRW
jgi:hypothetical protein